MHEAGVRDGSGFRRPVPGGGVPFRVQASRSGFRRPVLGGDIPFRVQASRSRRGGGVVHRAERAVDGGGAAAFDSDVRVEFVNGR